MTAHFSELLQELMPAERAVLDTLADSGFTRLGDGGLPQAEDPARAVRAAFLRALVLGGPEVPRVHEKGVRLAGGWITGALDFEGCEVESDLALVDCRFESALVLRSAKVETVFLDGSALPGVLAERLDAAGGLYLRSARLGGPVVVAGGRLRGEVVLDGVEAEVAEGVVVDLERIRAEAGLFMRGAVLRGGVRLPGARLEARIDAVGIRIERPGAVAFDADGVVTRGDFVLRHAHIRGETTLVGARIGGDVAFDGGHFSQPDDIALRLKRVVVDGAFFLRQGAVVEGGLSLNGASLNAIVDEPASWPPPGGLLLNRCLYGAFLGAPADAGTRLAWLALQDPARWGEDFWPQPYEQLSSVLADMGHDEDARGVLIEKERLQRRARRARAGSPALRAMLAVKDSLLAVTIGYGRQPLRAFAWLAFFWALGAGIFGAVEARDAMRPNVAVILRSPEWVLCGVEATGKVWLPSLNVERAGLADSGQSQLDCFRAQPEAASFPKFNAWMYSLDTLLPAMEIGQQAYWSADVRQPAGYAGKAYQYLQIVVGWGLSLLAVAGFSGIVRST